MPQSPKDRLSSATFSSLAQELSASGISFRFRAVGQSMYPTICNGEILHVEPIGNEKLVCGDIVLFHRCDGLKAHRIVKIRGEAFVTRGDSSLQVDGEVGREQIVGRVVAKEGADRAKLVPLVGLGARMRFRMRKLRGLIGLLIRRKGSMRTIAERKASSLIN